MKVKLLKKIRSKFHWYWVPPIINESLPEGSAYRVTPGYYVIYDVKENKEMRSNADAGFFRHCVSDIKPEENAVAIMCEALGFRYRYSYTRNKPRRDAALKRKRLRLGATLKSAYDKN